jgi:hypothetical protein
MSARLRDVVVEATEHDGSTWLGMGRDELMARLGDISDEALLRLWDAEVMSRPSGASTPWIAVAFARSAILRAATIALKGSE